MNSQPKIEMTDDLSVHKKAGMRTKTNNFKRWYNAGLLSNVDEDFTNEIQNYWLKHYGKEIDPYIHIASMNLNGKKDIRFIPQTIMRKEILPVFNDYDKSLFYGDKNIYDLVIDPPRSVETVLRNINGNYFDATHASINLKSATEILLDHDRDLIIKPSQTNNGVGIEKITIRGSNILLNEEIITLKDLEEKYEENFMVQKVLQQHPDMAAPHPASINTLRMVTFRWDNEIRHLLTFARFGSDNDIRDNGDVETSPRVGVTDSGEFLKVGISQNGQTFTHHPSTGYCFADLKPIPNFNEFKQFVIDCHKKLLHLNFASWDIVVGVDRKPVFLEVNFGGSTSFYQLVTQKPIFGDLTSKVLEHVIAEHQRKEPVLMYRHRRQIAEREARKKEKELDRNKKTILKLEEKNEKLRNQRRDLRKLLTEQENEMTTLVNKHKEEVNRLKKRATKHINKYRKIKNSKSYRYTKPLRKILKRFN